MTGPETRVHHGSNQALRRPVHGKGLLLFGLPFVTVGICLVLVAADVIATDDRSIHAPRWVLGVIGALFAVAGVMVLVQGIRGMVHRARIDAQALRHPGEPWYADYAWDPEGSREGRAGALAHLASGVLLIGMFAAIAHGLVREIGWGAWIIAGLLDLLALATLLRLVTQLRRNARYAPSELRFDRFPFLVGQSLAAEFVLPSGLEGITRLRFELRGIEERPVRSRGQDEARVVRALLHRDRYDLEAGVNLPASVARLPVWFELPTDLPGTQLSGVPVRFYELGVEGEADGVDFEACFLVPVYRPLETAVHTERSLQPA